jgi:cytochrome b561
MEHAHDRRMQAPTTHLTETAMLADLSPWHYSRLAVALHWSLAVLLAGMLALGWFMMSVEDELGSDWYFGQHKSVGILVALLVPLRLIWRLATPPAPLPASVPSWQARLATITQWALYAVMVLMPLSGYLGASYSEHGVALFGWPLPVWAPADHDRSEQFFDIHGALAWVLVALVAAHVVGSLKHLLKDKDGVFERMWFESPND